MYKENRVDLSLANLICGILVIMLILYEKPVCSLNVFEKHGNTVSHIDKHISLRPPKTFQLHNTSSLDMDHNADPQSLSEPSHSKPCSPADLCVLNIRKQTNDKHRDFLSDPEFQRFSAKRLKSHRQKILDFKEKKPQKEILLPDIYYRDVRPQVHVESCEKDIPRLFQCIKQNETWTYEEDIVKILSSVLQEPDLQPVNLRIDSLPTHISVTSGFTQTAAEVLGTSNSEQYRCRIISDTTFGELSESIESWCSNLFSWTSALFPNYLTNLKKATIRLKFFTELHCHTLTNNPKNPGQQIYNTDFLWGLVEDLGDFKRLASESYEFLTSWSRVTIVRSDVVDEVFERYITKKYLIQNVEANGFSRNVLKGCSALSLLQHSYLLLNGSVVFHWPKHYYLKRVYELLMPSCLGLYPQGTIIEFSTETDVIEHHKVICDETGHFNPYDS